jgi:tetratricopeptide (TPR) repeat protein
MNKRLDYLLQLYAATPEDAFVLFALAKEYEGVGEQEMALEYYLTLRRVQPSYVGLYYHLGKLYEALQHREAALEAYHSGIQIAKAAGDAHAANELNGAKLNLEYED